MSVVGAIEIQMLADIAQLKKDMEQAKGIVKGGADAMTSSFSAVGAAFKGVLAGIGISAVANFVDQLFEAASQFHDLSQQTGASVEALSHFAAVGATTGTTVEKIGSLMNKLSKAVAETKTNSGEAAGAFKALGLDIEKFRALKPEERFIALADAQVQFADGAGKSAAMMTLLGRTGAEAIPFLNDLAEQQKINARLTGEQAASADDLKDAMAAAWFETKALLMQGAVALWDAIKGAYWELRGLVTALMFGLEAEWERFQMVVGTVWLAIREAAAGALDFLGSAMAGFMGGVASALEFFGADEMAASVRDAASAVRDATADTTDWGAEAAKLRGEYDQTVGTIRQNRDESLEWAREQGKVKQAVEDTRPQVQYVKGDLEEAAKQAEAARKAFEKMAQDGEKLANKLLAAGSLFSPTFEEDLEKLSAAFTAGKINAAELEEAVKRLEEAQPGAVAAMKHVAEQAQAIADARRRESADIDKWIEDQQKAQSALTGQIKSAADAVDAELSNYGKLRSEIALTELARLEDARTRATEGSKLAGEIDEQIRQQQRLIAGLKEQEWRSAWTSVADGLTDALMAGGDSVVRYLKQLFAQTVLRPIVQMVMAPVGQMVTSVLSGFSSGTLAGPAGGATSGGGILGMLGQGASLFNAGTTALGSMASFGATGFMSTLAGTSLSTTLGAAGSLMANGSIMSGLGMGLGALGPYALAAAALYSIYKSMDDSGTPHVGGYALADALGGVTDITDVQGGIQQKDTQKGVEQIARLTSGIMNRIGGIAGAGAMSVRSVFESDSNDPSWGLFHILNAAGAQMAGSFDALGTLASDPKQGFEEYAQQAASGTIQALLALDLPTWVRDLVSSLDTAGATLDDVAKIADAIEQTVAALDSLELTLAPLGGLFTQIASASDEAQLELANMVGGIDSLIQKAQGFVQAYYSKDEQAALTAAQIMREAGLGLPPGAAEALAAIGTRGEYRGLVEGIDFAADGGAAMAAFGLNWAGAFASISEYLEANGLTLGELAAQAIVPAFITGFQDAAEEAAASAADAGTAAADAVFGGASADPAASASAAPTASAASVFADLLAKLTEVHEEIVGARAERLAADAGLVEPIAAVRTLADRWDRDGLLVRGETDQPIYTTAAP